MSKKEPPESEDEAEDRSLNETELEQAANAGENLACFRMLEEDFLIKRIERKGWRR